MASPLIIPSNSLLLPMQCNPPVTMADIAESVRSTGPGTGSLSWGDAGENLEFDTKWIKEYGAGLVILGYSYMKPAVGVNAPTLSRVAPMMHPTKLWLNASAIDNITRLSPKGKAIAPVAGPPQGSNNTGAVVAKILPPTSPQAPNKPTGTEIYQTSRFRVSFRPYMYKLYNDQEYVVGNKYVSEDALNIVDESQRYVEYSGEPASEFLTRDGNTFAFASTAAGAAGNGGNLPTPFVVLESKNQLKVKWNRVPEDFVSDFPCNFPAIQACMQTVNKYKFLGKNPCTLLLRGFHFERHPVPGDVSQGGQVLVYVDFTFDYLWFDPQNRGSYEVTNNLYGHILAPMPGDSFAYHVYTASGNTPATGSHPVYTDNNYRYNLRNHSAMFRYQAATTAQGGVLS